MTKPTERVVLKDGGWIIYSGELGTDSFRLYGHGSTYEEARNKALASGLAMPLNTKCGQVRLAPKSDRI